MSITRTDLRRVLVEALAIFAAVVLGLAADAWRERVANRAEASEALAILLEDLAADSIGMERLIDPLLGHVRSALWFQRVWGQPVVDSDSLGLAYRRLLFVRDPRFRRAAYETLLDGDRLSLISDVSLRHRIVQYFDEEQSAARFWVEGHARQRLERTLNVLTPHFLLPPGRDSLSVFPIGPEPVPIASSWGELRADKSAYNEIVGLAWWAEIAVGYIESAQEENSRLRDHIRRELDIEPLD